MTDLQGEVFHQWKVIRFEGYLKRNGKGNRKAIWVAQCMKCGTESPVFAEQFLLGGNPRCSVCNGVHNNLLSIYRNNARTRHLEFALSPLEAQELFQGNCKYCGIAPQQKFKHAGREYVYNGIDRIDNTRGYVSDNCVSCCGTCNIAKNAMCYEEFVAWVKRVATHLQLFPT